MKKTFSSRKIWAFTALCAFTLFTSCSKEDSTPSVTDLAGEYSGKMVVTTVNPLTSDIPNGEVVSAQIKNDSIYFDKLPVTQLITAIAGEENAEKIILAVGDVKYKIGYKAVMDAKQDTIRMELTPKPLVLTVPLTDGAAPLVVTVSISAPEKGIFSYEGSRLAFQLVTDEIKLGESVLPFPPFSLNFYVTKK